MRASHAYGIFDTLAKHVVTTMGNLRHARALRSRRISQRLFALRSPSNSAISHPGASASMRSGTPSPAPPAAPARLRAVMVLCSSSRFNIVPGGGKPRMPAICSSLKRRIGDGPKVVDAESNLDDLKRMRGALDGQTLRQSGWSRRCARTQPSACRGRSTTRRDGAGRQPALIGQLPRRHATVPGDDVRRRRPVRLMPKGSRPSARRRSVATWVQPARVTSCASGFVLTRDYLDPPRYSYREISKSSSPIKPSRPSRRHHYRIDQKNPMARRASRRLPPSATGGGPNTGDWTVTETMIEAPWPQSAPPESRGRGDRGGARHRPRR